MRTTICLLNQKGGSAKSSTCFHLAGAFASSGLRVLLIDIDPQASLSQGFFGSTWVEELPRCDNLVSIFDEDQFFSAPNPKPTDFERISILPTNHELRSFNTPNPETLGVDQFLLRDFIDGQHAFDIVLIDCPPNLCRCSWSALLASDFVLIPVPPEDFGTQGLRSVHNAIHNARILNPTLRRLGHLITRCDKRLLIHRSYEKQLRKNYPQLMLETVIPEASAFKVSLSCRKPVEYHDSSSKAAKLTRQLSREILDRINTKNEQRRVA